MSYLTLTDAPAVFAGEGQRCEWFSTTWGNLTVGDVVNDYGDRVAVIESMSEPTEDGLIVVVLQAPVEEHRRALPGGMPLTVPVNRLIRRMRVTE